MSLPDRALSNFDIEKVVKELKIRNFRGTPMRDALPKKPWKEECGIMKLDSSKGQGNHWKAWVKRGKAKVFFDSYGLNPPNELVKYLGKNIYVNTTQVQKENTYLCGHYCLYVLAATSNSTESTLLKDVQLAINELF